MRKALLCAKWKIFIQNPSSVTIKYSKLPIFLQDYLEIFPKICHRAQLDEICFLLEGKDYGIMQILTACCPWQDSETSDFSKILSCFVYYKVKLETENCE